MTLCICFDSTVGIDRTTLQRLTPHVFQDSETDDVESGRHGFESIVRDETGERKMPFKALPTYRRELQLQTPVLGSSLGYSQLSAASNAVGGYVGTIHTTRILTPETPRDPLHRSPLTRSTAAAVQQQHPRPFPQRKISRVHAVEGVE